jgi:quercetin dioxygenase-like cupin family protein
MRRSLIGRAFSILAVTLLTAMSASPAALAQQPNVDRKVLVQEDLTTNPGYQVVLVAVTIPVGGREGRHMHPGTLVGQVLEGSLTLEQEGRPTVTYKAGESILVEPGRVHEGINKGNVPIRIVATFIVEKGKPLATQVK